MDPIHLTIAIFVFALGACVGSFLNVVVYRLPLGKSLVTPPSSCPKCGHRLAAYDNVPIFGWLWLLGKCRYCRTPISARYPLVEFITGALFLAQYLLLFHFGWGPYEVTQAPNAIGIFVRQYQTLTIENDWPVLLIHLWLIGSLLAASLIDLEHFIIPLGVCWLLALVGALVQAFLIKPGALGSLHMNPMCDAIALGSGIGLLLSLVLLRWNIFKQSFAEDAPLLEVEREKIAEADQPDPWPASRIRAEMRKEILFLLPPIAFGAAAAALVMGSPQVASVWDRLSAEPHISGFLGALLGALVGGFVVWFFRIAGSYGFGREAMGLGDVHLMFGVGAVVGAGGATVAFFLAPIFGLGIAVIQLMLSGRRELPYGPYLSLASYFVLLFYTPISEYLRPGMQGLIWMVQDLLGKGAA